LIGKTRPFDPYKGAKSLASYFRIALRFVSYFSRVVAPDKYYFSLVAGVDDDVEDQRPEDIIKATDDQLVVWREICDLVRQIRASRTEDYDDSDNNDDDNVLKERLLKLWMLLICYTIGARRYRSLMLSFCAMLSIKPSIRSWMEPGNFNSSLSAMIWIVQLLVFYDSALKEQRGYSKTLKLVKAYYDEYLQ
jgi:hypothetical protein